MGIVGLSPAAHGWALTVLVPSLLSVSNFYQIYAIGSRALEAAEEAASKVQQILQTSKDIKLFVGSDAAIQIASDPDVDLVVIAVQSPYHYDVVRPVIELGKPFFLEWPLGGNHVFEIAKATEEKHVRNMVGLQWQQALSIRKVCA